jgi:hypothetical protein
LRGQTAEENKTGNIEPKVVKATKVEQRPEKLSKSDMQSMLKDEFSPKKLEQQLKDCCSEHAKCSDDLKELAAGIEELYKLQPAKIAAGVAGMEKSLVQKCHQIKESRALITQLLTQSVGALENLKDMGTQPDALETKTQGTSTQIDATGGAGGAGALTKNFGQQADTAPKEVIKEVEKIVTQTVKELIEVEKIIEKPIFTEKV